MRVGVFGAGAIGAYVGVCLSAAGAEVVLVDLRPIDPATLRATDRRGNTHRGASSLAASRDPAVLADVDVCLVAVKSQATMEAGQTLAGVLPEACPVVSLQNGLRNPARLRETLRGPVVPAVVGFNVTAEQEGHLRQTVPGPLLLGRDGTKAEATIAALAALVGDAIGPVRIVNDIEARMRGKLLLNLNNGICGATGLGIAQMLADADARWCFARCLREGDRIFRAAGMPAARVGLLGARELAWVLRLPTAILQLGARGRAAVDPAALPSTLQDLRSGRDTEIDELNGEIVRIGDAHDLPAPCNRVVLDVVHAHEARLRRGQTPKWIAAEALRRRMHARLATTATAPRSIVL